MRYLSFFRLPLISFSYFNSPRDSQGSFPTPLFKSINYLVLSYLYGPTLTSVHDYWKSHSFDSMGLVSKVISMLLICCLVLSQLFFQGQVFLFVCFDLICFLISWLQSLSTVILESKKIKSVTVSIFPHLFALKLWDQLP